jgi:hypothetical protein
MGRHTHRGGVTPIASSTHGTLASPLSQGLGNIETEEKRNATHIVLCGVAVVLVARRDAAHASPAACPRPAGCSRRHRRRRRPPLRPSQRWTERSARPPPLCPSPPRPHPHPSPAAHPRLTGPRGASPCSSCPRHGSSSACRTARSARARALSPSSWCAAATAQRPCSRRSQSARSTLSSLSTTSTSALIGRSGPGERAANGGRRGATNAAGGGPFLREEGARTAACMPHDASRPTCPVALPIPPLSQVLRGRVGVLGCDAEPQGQGGPQGHGTPLASAHSLCAHGGDQRPGRASRRRHIVRPPLSGTRRRRHPDPGAAADPRGGH